jgi:hypothetical protein
MTVFGDCADDCVGDCEATLSTKSGRDCVDGNWTRKSELIDCFVFQANTVDGAGGDGNMRVQILNVDKTSHKNVATGTTQAEGGRDAKKLPGASGAACKTRKVVILHGEFVIGLKRTSERGSISFPQIVHHTHTFAPISRAHRQCDFCHFELRILNFRFSSEG